TPTSNQVYISCLWSPNLEINYIWECQASKRNAKKEASEKKLYEERKHIYGD
nr:hypothetical protein [Tanacetum cinerariifolium]